MEKRPAYMNTRTVFLAAFEEHEVETPHFDSLSFCPRRAHLTVIAP